MYFFHHSSFTKKYFFSHSFLLTIKAFVYKKMGSQKFFLILHQGNFNHSKYVSQIQTVLYQYQIWTILELFKIVSPQRPKLQN